MSLKTIVVGFISPDAEAFLKAHQVHLNQYLGLSIIALDENIAIVNQGEKLMEYVLAFWSDGGEDVEEDCIIVELNVDAYTTCVTLHKDYWTSFVLKP